MELYNGYINKLIEQFSKLPGIGNKSAQRLALHIINMPAEHVEHFAQIMVDARKNIHYFTDGGTQIMALCIDRSSCDTDQCLGHKSGTDCRTESVGDGRYLPSADVYAGG